MTVQIGRQVGRHGGRWQITGIVDADERWARSQPPPWLAQPLHIRGGTRVVVAAPAALAAAADTITPLAEQAAAAVERYTRPTARPDRYVIYLAGPGEEARWYGKLRPHPNVIGMAVPLSRRQIDIVLPMDRLEPAHHALVLRHEMGHVLTLLGEPGDHDYRPRIPEWAAEGIAEYIGWTANPPGDYPRLPGIRRYLAAHRWNGTLPVPIDYADQLATSATYGLNYLLLRHLADRFGEPAMLRFIDLTLRRGDPPESAALAVYGQPWTRLTTQAATAIATTVR
jgi:hypothetical protein